MKLALLTFILASAINVIPQPLSVREDKGTFNLKGTPIACDAAMGETALAAVKDFSANLTLVAGQIYPVSTPVGLSATIREGKALFKDMDMAVYSKKIFGMFGGVEETVVLECKNGISGVIIDRFGTEVDIIKRSADSFTVRVNVQISPQFLGWVFSLGENIKIISPDSVIKRMRDEITRIKEIYN